MEKVQIEVNNDKEKIIPIEKSDDQKYILTKCSVVCFTPAENKVGLDVLVKYNDEDLLSVLPNVASAWSKSFVVEMTSNKLVVTNNEGGDFVGTLTLEIEYKKLE